MDNHLADMIGMLGTANIVGAYMLLQFNRIDAKGLAFNCINLCGAILLLISLLVNFNLASFVIEVFWIAASLVGLVQYFRRRQARAGEDPG